jgi:DNA polymerase-3 subunit beta
MSWLQALMRERSVSKDETRPVLTGFTFGFEQADTLTLVTSDSYRLTHYELTAEVAAQPPKFAVPLRAARQLRDLMVARDATQVEIGPSGGQVAFGIADELVWCYQQDPFTMDYFSLISDIKIPLIVSRERLSRTARRVGAVTRFWLHEGELRLRGKPQQRGYKLLAEIPEGIPENLEVGINSQFLMDGIQSIRGERLRLDLVDELKPTVLRPVHADNVFHLIMPIRLSV